MAAMSVSEKPRELDEILRTVVGSGVHGIAYAKSIDPAELQRRIAAQNTPRKVAALYRRLAGYRRNRQAAERAYYAEAGR